MCPTTPPAADIFLLPPTSGLYGGLTLQFKAHLSITGDLFHSHPSINYRLSRFRGLLSAPRVCVNVCVSGLVALARHGGYRRAISYE